VKVEFQSTAYQLDLVPIDAIAPAIELSAPEITHGCNERRVAYLGPQAEEFRPVKLITAVDRKAVSCAGELGGEHRDFSGIRAKMRVNVRCSTGTNQRCNAAGLDEVKDMQEYSAIAPAHHAKGHCQCAGKAAGPHKKKPDCGLQQVEWASKQIGGAPLFFDIARIHQFACRAGGHANDPHSRSLQRKHLSLDKGMTDGRILIDQIENRRPDALGTIRPARWLAA